MNQQVTATGLTVSAEAPSSLLISNTSATEGFGASVVCQNDTAGAAELEYFVPVTYADACASWYQLTTDGAIDVGESGALNTESNRVTDGGPAANFTGLSTIYTSSTSVFHETVWLKAEGENSVNVAATAAWDGDTPTAAIAGALHVVFVVDGAVAATIDMTTPAGQNNVTLATLTNASGAKQVDIYYFLSGNDADCKNSNITADATISIKLTFAEAVTGGEG